MNLTRSGVSFQGKCLRMALAKRTSETMPALGGAMGPGGMRLYPGQPLPCLREGCARKPHSHAYPPFPSAGMTGKAARCFLHTPGTPPDFALVPGSVSNAWFGSAEVIVLLRLAVVRVEVGPEIDGVDVFAVVAKREVIQDVMGESEAVIGCSHRLLGGGL